MVSVDFLKQRYYPDSSKDGTVIFYRWLRQYVRTDYTVMNIGAGPTADKKVKSLKGQAKQVIGVDIDETVLNNEDLDQAIVIENGKFPFTDNYFDLAWADFVLEHVENPMSFLQEIKRVLRPGASFFFRTPNKYHYVSLIGRMTPHWFHELVANRVRRMPPDAHKPYPTCYRLNSRNEIQKYAQVTGFKRIEMKMIEAEPSYLVFHPIAFRMGVAYERVVNHRESFDGLRANILGRLEK